MVSWKSTHIIATISILGAKDRYIKPFAPGTIPSRNQKIVPALISPFDVPMLRTEIDVLYPSLGDCDARGSVGPRGTVQEVLGELDSRIHSFRNEDGWVRRRLVQGLDLNLRQDRELLGETYSEWVLDDIFLTLKHTTSRTVVQTDQTETETEYVATKARKRGNDVDVFRIGRRMKVIKENVLPFIPDNLRSTGAIYITGTVDPKKVGQDALVAWTEFGKWFNSFISGLRKKCMTVEISEKDGKLATREVPARIHVLRSWESHASGWPHFHAVLCFEGYSWAMFQDKSSKWRIKQKSVIQDSWTHGFVDVLALTRGTLDRNIQNVLWYVAKNLSDQDYRLVRSWPVKKRETQSILWMLGKRAFSISKALAASDLEPEPGRLDKAVSIIQVDLDGKQAILEVHRWEFIGLVHQVDTELTREDWEKVYPNPPDWLDRAWNPWKFHNGLDQFSSWLSGGS